MMADRPFILARNELVDYMKQKIQKISDEILAAYPIKDIVKGWFFKIDEVSNGVYEVEGIDFWGRKVSRKGLDTEEILKLCVKDAQDVNANIIE
jgi:pyrroloquinoline quinone (PQQ) biosynthesis protein C